MSVPQSVLGTDPNQRKTVFIFRRFRFTVGVKIAVPVHTH